MNIVNIPSYLTQQDIHQWINRIGQSLDALFGNYYISSFFAAFGSYKLEFSDELIWEDGEPISLDDAKADLIDMVKDRCDNAEYDEHIKRLFQRIEKAETVGQLRECASAIAEYCASGDTREERSESYDEIKESILDLLGRAITVGQSNRLYILGRYYHYERKIVLYVRAINPSGLATRLPLFEEVFAHEAFHAYHYYACEIASKNAFLQELPKRTDYTSKVVKESLAAFFEFYYCGRNGISTDIDNDWRMNPVYIYPYSGARYLSLSGNCASFLFKNVFETSLHDLDKALRLLLEKDMDAFYDVKNVKEKIVKTVTKQVLVTAAPPTLGATIADREIEKALKQMGRGWFILKYAEEYRGMPSPLPLDYGDPKSFGIRMSQYLKNKPFHGEIIRFLKRNRLGLRTSAGVGSDTVRYNELQDILDTL